MSPFRRHRRVARAVAGGAVVLGGLISASSASAATGRDAIPGTHPAWAVSQGSATPAVTSGAVRLNVYLAGQNPAGLVAFAREVSDPSSAEYGDYLSAAQVRAKYGPTGAEASAVKAWLTGRGFTVAGVTSGIGAYVAVSGTLEEAGDAFGIRFGDYRDPEGTTARAPESAATVPASIAADVLSVSGLSTAPDYLRPQTGDPLPNPGPNYFVAPPTSSYYGQKLTDGRMPTAEGQHWPWAVAGYTPQQIRGAYGVTASGMTGAGQTVAIVDAYASPTMESDANEFSEVTGNQPFADGQYKQYTPPGYSLTSEDQCDAASWYGEETLDVESVHDMAPSADVHFVAASNCNDPALAEADAKIVDHHLASIVSNSFGVTADTEQIAPVWDEIFEAGAAEGIGFFVSSGESGYEDPVIEDPGFSDAIQVDYPSSSPWVTSVGGTSLAIGATDNYEWETSWGTVLDPLAAGAWTYAPPPPFNASTYDGSSGGGVSTLYSQPWYQAKVVPSSLATALPDGTTSATPMRVVPDVSALADPATGMLVGETAALPGGGYGFELSRIGGTSVASPTFAGIEADAQQAARRALGFANPAIYERSGTAAFHDVTDSPFPGEQLYEVRNNYGDPYTHSGGFLTYLRLLGEDGVGADALPAVTGYDDATGVGSPAAYIQSFH